MSNTLPTPAELVDACTIKKDSNVRNCAFPTLVVHPYRRIVTDVDKSNRTSSLKLCCVVPVTVARRRTASALARSDAGHTFVALLMEVISKSAGVHGLC